MTRKPRIDGQEKRQQLLLSAGEVFAARGFRNATLAEICRKARANNAAVNYHFGSKETLYVESWRFAFERSLRTYPPDGGVPAEFAGWKFAAERTHSGHHAPHHRSKEAMNWTLFLRRRPIRPACWPDVTQQALEPIFHGFSRDHPANCWVRRASEQQVRLCLMSIRAQCFGPADAGTSPQAGCCRDCCRFPNARTR